MAKWKKDWKILRGLDSSMAPSSVFRYLLAGMSATLVALYLLTLFNRDTGHAPSYVYHFSSFNPSFPGIMMAKVPVECLPPGSSTVRSAGRLGNVILEYASLWALGRMYHLPTFVPDEMATRLSQVFKHLSLPHEEEFLSDKNCHSGDLMNMDSDLEKIDQDQVSLDEVVETSTKLSKPIVLQTCVILVEALVPLASEIKSNFPYLDEFTEDSHEELSKIKSQIMKSDQQIKEVLFIGVHVRRTDYADQLMLLYNSMRPADESFFGRAIQRVRSQVLPPGGGTETVQIVTSDDPEWVRSTLLPHLQDIGLKHTFFAGDGDLDSPEHDLALLSHCNHSVFAYGTYGMWTALWAGGRTVVYDLDEGDAVSPAMQFARNLPLWEALK